MQISKSNLVIYLILTILFFIYFFLSIFYYSGDIRNHVFWGENILKEGPAGFYIRDMQGWSYPNYPPISMLSFAVTVWFYNFTKSSLIALNNVLTIFPSNLIPWIESPNVYFAFLKIPAIIPLILSGYLIFLFGKHLKKSFKQNLFYTLLFVINPGLFYLTVVWGQNDFLQILFILMAFYLVLKEKYLLSYIFAALSIMSKQTVLMAWGVFLITIFKLKGLSKSLTAVLVSIIILWFSYTPFNNTGPLWPFTYYNETLKSTGFMIADNSINIWGTIANHADDIDAAQVKYFLSYEHWGFLAFALIFFPLLYKYLKTKFSPELLFYFLFVSSITYFFVLTRMHERYLFFGVVFAHLLVMTNKKYWYNLVFFSILYFLNLYRGLLQPDFPILVKALANNTFLNSWVVCYLIILIYNFYYFMFQLKHNEKK